MQPHRICLSVPLYHCFGCVIGTLCGMLHGATNILPCPSFNGAACVEAIEAERCTSIYGTPTMFIDILAAARERRPDVSHVETGIMAGEKNKVILRMLPFIKTLASQSI